MKKLLSVLFATFSLFVLTGCTINESAFNPPSESVETFTTAPRTAQVFDTNQTFNVGDTVLLGCFNQSKEATHNHGFDPLRLAKEPIEWVVVCNENNESALLLSKYALDSSGFSEDEKYSDITQTEAYRWINYYIINGVFMKLDGIEKYIKYPNEHKTKVFLLNADEFQKYVANTEYAKCKMTYYASIEGQYSFYKDENGKYQVSQYAWWWLEPSTPGTLEAVSAAGHHGFPSDSQYSDPMGIRPALWLDLTAIQ